MLELHYPMIQFLIISNVLYQLVSILKLITTRSSFFLEQTFSLTQLQTERKLKVLVHNSIILNRLGLKTEQNHLSSQSSCE